MLLVVGRMWPVGHSLRTPVGFQMDPMERVPIKTSCIDKLAGPLEDKETWV